MKADTVTKDYVKDAGVFADIFNYYIYGGRQVILPEQLTERDSTKIALPYGADGAVVPVQKFRDVQKLYAAMTDGKMEYVLYGAENQAEIHYAMPVKNNLYDALEYAGKYDEEDEVVNVCQAIQEMRKEERQIGELNKAKEAARNFYNLGVDVEKIAQGVGYAVETVKEWLGLES